MKVIVNSRDTVSLNRIINFPPRGIGQVTLQKLNQWARENSQDLYRSIGKVDQIESIPAKTRKKISDFYALIVKYTDLKNKFSLAEFIHTLVDEIGLVSMYKEDTTIEGTGKVENVREFLSAIGDYASSTDDISLEGFLAEVSLMTDVDAWDDRSNAVTLMTLHCAKGLEFPVVFIAGLEDGLLPVSRSMDDQEALEEERRLFYVGITRAKDKVYLSHARTRHLYGENGYRIPSRFLDELDSEVVHIRRLSLMKSFSHHSPHPRKSVDNLSQSQPDYESFSQEIPQLIPGVFIEHASFGKGKILKIEGTGEKQKVVVRFDDGMEKKFLSRYAQFNII